MRGNEAPKLGGQRGGGLEGIQLYCSWGGHLPGTAWLSPIPSPHFSSTQTPPPPPPSSPAHTSAVYPNALQKTFVQVSCAILLSSTGLNMLRF